jgi:hypothetical protein
MFPLDDTLVDVSPFPIFGDGLVCFSERKVLHVCKPC